MAVLNGGMNGAAACFAAYQAEFQATPRVLPDVCPYPIRDQYPETQKEVASYETTSCESNLKPLSDLLCDLCSLALTIAEIIKLCSSDLTLTNNVDVIDLG